MHQLIKAANPQGKGVVSVLDNLREVKNHLRVSAKTIREISNELFTSLFVLNSEIRFQPKLNQTYWLYSKNQKYRLSLIAPEQWSPAQYGRFIGACELQADLVWSLNLSADCAADPAFLRHIADQRRQLEQRLQQAEKVEDVLPVYVQALPFYARILASALAYSLKQSMRQSGIAGLSFSTGETGAACRVNPDSSAAEFKFVDGHGFSE